MLGGMLVMLLQLTHILIPTAGLGIFSSTDSVVGLWDELAIVCGLYILFATLAWKSPAAAGRWKWLFAATGLLSVAVLYATLSLHVWIAVIVGLLVASVLAWLESRRQLSEPRVLLYGGSAAAALILCLSTILVAPYMPERLQQLSVYVRPSWVGTWHIVKGVYSSPKNALVGTGPQTFDRDWTLHKPTDINTTVFWNVDFAAGVGFIPTEVITVGALGILSWLSVFAASIWAAIVYIRRRRPDALIFTYLASVLYLLYQHLVFVPGIVLSVLLFLLLGVVAIALQERRFELPLRAYTWRMTLFSAIAVVGLCGSLVLLVLGVRDTYADTLINRSIDAFSRSGDIEHSLSLLQRALAIDPRNDRAQRASVELGLLQLRQLAQNSAPAEELQRTIQQTIEHGLRAVSINGGDYQNWLALAGLYKNLAGAGVEGAYQNARDAFERAVRANPSNPLLYLQLAQVAIAQRDFAGALQHLSKAIELKPDLPAAMYLRSLVHAEQKNLDMALADAQLVVQLRRSDPLGYYTIGRIYYAREEYDKAAASLEAAVTLRSEYSDALLLLALSYDELGREEDALRMLMRLESLNPEIDVIKQAIQNVRAGKPGADALQQKEI